MSFTDAELLRVKEKLALPPAERPHWIIRYDKLSDLLARLEAAEICVKRIALKKPDDLDVLTWRMRCGT